MFVEKKKIKYKTVWNFKDSLQTLMSIFVCDEIFMEIEIILKYSFFFSFKESFDKILTLFSRGRQPLRNSDHAFSFL